VKAKLVPSIAGKHEGWPKVLLTGHVRLMRAVRDMGLRTGKGKGKSVSLEYQVRPHFFLPCLEVSGGSWQGSSIGTYSTQWMNEFHWSARGESAEDWLDVRRAHREKLPYPPVKIIFPSLKTVRATVLGEPVRL
jgi:tyrosyl-DNA phosphodiesterase-1